MWWPRAGQTCGSGFGISRQDAGAFTGSNPVHSPANASKPLILRQSATFDDRSHGAEWEDPSTVVWHDNLLASHGISPFLVAAGTSRHLESAAA